MKIHPAISDDEVHVWNACRQLMFPGARVEVSNYSWESHKKASFDPLYYRGLALRHSNGETGKYEMFAYVPTEKLLVWARQQDLLRASFNDALKGRDVQKELRNLRRRARYAEQRDRPKHWPGDPLPSGYTYPTGSEVEAQHKILNSTTDPAAYTRSWAFLNHLKV